MLKVKASFDDGCQLDLRVAELLTKYGIDDATFYIPSMWHDVNRLHGDVPLTTSEVIELSKEYTIGSHTITHPMLTRINKDEAYKEITESKYALHRLLGKPVESFCYPRGYANDYLRNIVSKYYKSARNTLVGNLLPPIDPIWETPTVHISGKRRTEYEDTTWFDEGIKLFNEAKSRVDDEDIVYHFWGHSWEINKYDDWKKFESLLAYISAVTR